MRAGVSYRGEVASQLLWGWGVALPVFGGRCLWEAFRYTRSLM